MNIEETKEAISVMQAFVDGNEVEYQISDGTWWDALTPSWNWASTRYRIKPTPLRYARELERELNAANSIIRQQQLLDEENLRLQERIKRLEEAGDELAGQHLFAVHTYDNAKKHVAEWYKSKEGNP